MRFIQIPWRSLKGTAYVVEIITNNSNSYREQIMGLDLTLLQKLQELRLHDTPEDDSMPQTPRNKGSATINTPHFPGHLPFVF